MFRVERSPDRPMFVPGEDGAARGEAIFCIGDTVDPMELLRRVPHRRMRAEPDPAAAIAHCLSKPVHSLVIDLAPLSARGLSALAQLRLMRPGLRILLVTTPNGAVALKGTVLEGLPVLSPRRAPTPNRRVAALDG